MIWLALPQSDPHYSMKVRMLGNTKIGIGNGVLPNQPKRFQIPIDYAEDVTKECFSFLRFVHAKDSELLLLSSNEKVRQSHNRGHASSRFSTDDGPSCSFLFLSVFALVRPASSTSRRWTRSRFATSWRC